MQNGTVSGPELSGRYRGTLIVGAAVIVGLGFFASRPELRRGIERAETAAEAKVRTTEVRQIDGLSVDELMAKLPGEYREAAEGLKGPGGGSVQAYDELFGGEDSAVLGREARVWVWPTSWGKVRTDLRDVERRAGNLEEVVVSRVQGRLETAFDGLSPDGAAGRKEPGSLYLGMKAKRALVDGDLGEAREWRDTLFLALDRESELRRVSGAFSGVSRIWAAQELVELAYLAEDRRFWRETVDGLMGRIPSEEDRVLLFRERLVAGHLYDMGHLSFPASFVWVFEETEPGDYAEIDDLTMDWGHFFAGNDEAFWPEETFEGAMRIVRAAEGTLVQGEGAAVAAADEALRAETKGVPDEFRHARVMNGALFSLYAEVWQDEPNIFGKIYLANRVDLRETLEDWFAGLAGDTDFRRRLEAMRRAGPSILGE